MDSVVSVTRPASNRAVLIAGTALALLTSGWACTRVGDDYAAFVAHQNAAYDHAQRVAAAAIERYAHAEETITVRIENPTDGSASFYIGTANATSEAAPVVGRAPQLVATLKPHRQRTMHVSDWFNRYVRTVTTYGSLAPERSPVIRFADLNYTSSAAGYVTTVVAQPNLSDVNYRALDDIAGTFPAADVHQNQSDAVAAYRAAHSVNRGEFTTGLFAYVGSTLPRLGLP